MVSVQPPPSSRPMAREKKREWNPKTQSLRSTSCSFSSKSCWRRHQRRAYRISRLPHLPPEQPRRRRTRCPISCFASTSWGLRRRQSQTSCQRRLRPTFLLRFDFFVVVEESADAVELSAAAASASAFLLFFDFFGVEESADAVELSLAAASASAFLLFLDFFVVELSAGAAELSADAASAFLDFFDFFFVVVVL